MTLQEWWWEADQKIATQKHFKRGLGGHTEAEWEAARRKHREKMKAKENG